MDMRAPPVNQKLLPPAGARGALSVAEIILRHPLDARNVSHNQVELRKGIHEQACVRSCVMIRLRSGYDLAHDDHVRSCAAHLLKVHSCIFADLRLHRFVNLVQIHFPHALRHLKVVLFDEGIEVVDGSDRLCVGGSKFKV